jgi:hypothetical protein
VRRGHLGRRQPPVAAGRGSGEAVAQRAAGHVRHDVVGQPVGDSRVEQREDVRVAQAGHRLDLPQEPLGGEGGEAVVEHLDGDPAPVAQVAGEEHGGGSAAAQRPVDLVAAGDGGGQALGRGRPPPAAAAAAAAATAARAPGSVSPSAAAPAASSSDSTSRRSAASPAHARATYPARSAGASSMAACSTAFTRAQPSAAVGPAAGPGGGAPAAGAGGRHPAPSSRRSQARATAHSRLTVAGETPRRGGRLVDVQPPEVSELDDAPLLRVDRGEAGERVVEREHVERRAGVGAVAGGHVVA